MAESLTVEQQAQLVAKLRATADADEGEVAQLRLPIPIDTYIAPYGRIAAVMWDGTERLYFFIDKRGCVALMPAAQLLL